jgi:AraC-like DNA-binding protein
LTAYVLEFVAQLHGLLDVPAFCGLPVLIEPSPIRRPKLAASAQSIVRHLSLRIPGYQLAVHTHCIRLLDLLWKEALTQGPVSNATGTGRAMAVTRLLPVFRLIEARYAERLHLIDLAAVVHLHPAYLATVFKRLTGVAPLHYLARYRLERARTLLLATDRPLEEVARRTGFYDAAHLIRAFRAVEGDSPGHFRRSKARPISP